jgi:alkylhydroperoxidase/carboxymuconolactone decarboxylase family protein YurZ
VSAQPKTFSNDRRKARNLAVISSSSSLLDRLPCADRLTPCQARDVISCRGAAPLRPSSAGPLRASLHLPATEGSFLERVLEPSRSSYAPPDPTLHPAPRSERIISSIIGIPFFKGGTLASGLDDFQKFRADLNEEILACGHLGVKRFFALDHQAYEPGPLGTKTKELLGLVASAVLRSDDCITYHLVRCGEEGWKRDEVIDALNVAMIVGGSITIPHVRRAFASMREIAGLAS